MPTIPLYTSTALPHGWHNVRAPGGYEWWTLASEDRELRAGFFIGSPFSAEYRLRYRAYRLLPTMFKPPLPSDFCSARVRLNGRSFEAHGRLRQSASELSIGECSLLIEPAVLLLRFGEVQLRAQICQEGRWAIECKQREQVRTINARFEHLFSVAPPAGELIRQARF